MKAAEDQFKRCYLLMIDWFAGALSYFGFDGKPFVPIGRPHTHALVILSKVGVAKRLSGQYEFAFVCSREEVIKTAEANFDNWPPFPKVLENFIELSVYYGSARERAYDPFPVHYDVRELFFELEKLGFTGHSGTGFYWTEKLAPIMENIFNYEFLSADAAAASSAEPSGVFRYLE